MPSTLFFATRSDLLTFSSEVEHRLGVRYFAYGAMPQTGPRAYSTAATLPHLGVASSNATISCDMYLVAMSHVEIVPRYLEDFPKEALIDQLYNPFTIALNVGGMFDAALLAGSVGTVSDAKESLTLLAAWRRAMSKSMTRQGVYWVGAEARSKWKNGTRLTTAIDRPREYDLA